MGITNYRLLASRHTQQGVGLIEVLVALLLLAVAGLGYAALQTRALRSTDDALVRTQALTILNNAAEKIRTNGLQNNFVEVTTTTNSDGTKVERKTTKQILEYYHKQFNKAATEISSHSCIAATPCTATDIADNDVKELKTIASASDIQIGMDICPATNSKAATKCLIAAWGNTTPTIGDTQTDCMTSTGAYQFTSECVYMESY